MPRKSREFRPNEERVDHVGSLYTIPGAASRLGVNYQALDAYVNRKQIHCIMVGSTRLVNFDDVKNYRPRTKGVTERVRRARQAGLGEPGEPMVMQDDQIGGDD